jgi:uncharacterized protein (TIGR03086 family)
MDLLDLFERGTEWTASKIPGAANRLDVTTPCTDWDVRTLLNHMIDSQQYFAATARGEEATLPSPSPPPLIGNDPVAAYRDMRQETLRAHREPGVLEKTGPSLGIAFVDQLVHGWDLATATGQDAAMPGDLATAAFTMIDGQLTDDRRAPAFGPAVDVPDGSNAQDRLLAYTGRQPTG